VRLPRQCAYPGCTALTTDRFCAQHRAAGAAADAAKMRRRERRRVPRSERGYDYEWDRVRAAFLAQFPRCMLCGAPATEVHHRVPLRSGGTHDERNLMSLCGACHRRVHRRRG